MTTSRADLPVVVDRVTAVPLAAQISAQVRAAITAGVLGAGDRLPSTRDLAAALGVSRTVVTTAYAQLFAEGWLEGRHGSGTYVADVAVSPPGGQAPPVTPQWGDSASPHTPRGGDCPSPRTPLAPHPPWPPDPPAAFGSNLPGGATPRNPPAAFGSNLPGGATPRNPPAAFGDIVPAETSFPQSRAPAISLAASPAFAVSVESAISPGPLTSDELINLSPGIPWAAGIDPAVWRRAWRYAGTRPPSLWPDPHGLPELRAELAGYLRRSRGLSVTPANILVTRGVAGGLALLAAAMLRPGDRVGVEEPGYPTAREVLGRAGARVVPCRVDAHGIIPDELPGDLRLLYTTPAHQYPLGGRLPVGRRQALTAWARGCGAIVVEDDYDSEFRYDVGPLPALHSMDPDVIVYLGTASKVLAPAFGAGWLIGTPGLVERLARLRPSLGERVPEPVQHAMLALLTSGDLERHIRRMRLEYARRRAALVDVLARSGPGRLLGDTAGMHVVLELPADFPAGRLVTVAAARGVGLRTLDRYYNGPPALTGLILGYGAAPLTQVRRAANELGRLLGRPL